MNHIRRIQLLIGALIFQLSVTGCVSVSLSGGRAQKSENLAYSEPSAPFSKIKNPNVDVAWEHSQNGNMIAFLSECQQDVDSTLKEIAAENLAALSSVINIQTQNLNFNDREALHTSAEGLVDGVPVRMELLLFKKNGCTFTLSYVGRTKTVSANEPDFQRFIEGFKVP